MEAKTTAPTDTEKKWIPASAKDISKRRASARAALLAEVAREAEECPVDAVTEEAAAGEQEAALIKFAYT